MKILLIKIFIHDLIYGFVFYIFVMTMWTRKKEVNYFFKIFNTNVEKINTRE